MPLAPIQEKFAEVAREHSKGRFTLNLRDGATGTLQTWGEVTLTEAGVIIVYDAKDNETSYYNLEDLVSFRVAAPAKDSFSAQKEVQGESRPGSQN